MRFLHSRVITSAVLFGIGLSILLQVTPANAITNKAITTPIAAKPNQSSPAIVPHKSLAYTTQAISGLTAHIELLKQPSLWTDFRKSKEINSQLSRKPSKAFVLYKNISSDFLEATATIGFDVKEMKKAIGKTPLPAASKLTLLLPKGKYTDAQLIQGWSKIDYHRPIESIVEVNYLNNNSEPETTQLFVQYK
ncbi:hypothetical protein D5018_19315 [Parashewanella curva]|uniref:AraC family transcriptional regulator n=1 Tax=Parashewanella curva TaxID=2338552 RepID=A0A3L8PVE9_9GAMM|nr:hypothetical protein [Parashewanella curva]RLV58042.1 hypothetical protein D5018_19315 [Parashewanella curva]